MWLQAGNETTQRRLPSTSIIKDQNAKARSPGIKCASLLDIKFDGFSLAKLYQPQISCLHVVMKKIYKYFPRNLHRQSSFFLWKLIGLFFLWFLEWKWKICTDQSRLTVSSRSYATRVCGPTWACSQTTSKGANRVNCSFKFLQVSSLLWLAISCCSLNIIVAEKSTISHISGSNSFLECHTTKVMMPAADRH